MKSKGRFTVRRCKVLRWWSPLLSTAFLWMPLISPGTAWAQNPSSQSVTGPPLARGHISNKAITSAGYENLPKPGRDNAFSMTSTTTGSRRHCRRWRRRRVRRSGEGRQRGGRIDCGQCGAGCDRAEDERHGRGPVRDCWDAKAKKLYALNSSGWTAQAETIDAMKAKGITSWR